MATDRGRARVGRRAAPSGSDRRRRIPAAGLAALGALLGWAALAPGGAGAQQRVRTLDEGSFDITLAGHPVGHETFVIRREGAVVKAVGVVAMDSTRPPFVSEQVWLQTDSTFRPTLFQLKPRSGDVHNVVARRDGGRLRLQTSTEEGNRSQQFVASPDLAILEPGVAHQYYLLFAEHAARGTGTSWSMPVIVPSLGEQASVRVRAAGTESIEAAGQTRNAARYDLTLDGERIQVWLDDQGRVLEVRRPDRQWTAKRSSMKR